MHPYVMNEMVEERRAELYRLRSAGTATRAGIGVAPVPAWRRRLGRSLARLAVTMVVPAAERTPARRRVVDALCLDPGACS